MTNGQIVVELEISMIDGDHRAPAVVDGRQRQLEPSVRHDHARTRRNRAREAPQHGVHVFDGQAVFENYIAISEERLGDLRVRLARVLGTDRRIRKVIGLPVRQQVADVAEHAPQLVRQDVRHLALARWRHCATTSALTGRVASHAIVRSSPLRRSTRGSNPSPRTFEMSAYQRAVSPAKERPVGQIRMSG
jgi:hypothetical protein